MSTGSEVAPSGRLELTWTNKHRRLLAHEDRTYEWTDPGDHRVAEVRLLHDVTTVGKTYSDRSRAKDNLLIRGDALHALTSLSLLPEFRKEYLGKVKLAYIDPPFNTQQAFVQYNDALEHSVWLTMMRDRLSQVQDLLSPDGSVWVHLDDEEAAYCRVLMDEIFGRAAFVGSVVWENFYGRSNAAAISPSHNTLLVYAPAGRERWRAVRNLLPRDEDARSRYANPDEDARGPWRNGPIFAPEERHDGLMYTVVTPGGREVRPPRGSHWRMPEPEFWRMVDEGRITFGQDGTGAPAVKLFLNEIQEGLVPRSWWPHSEVGHSQEAKRELQAQFSDKAPFSTPKPERLLERIIRIATNPGDVVLDFFLGSGTTAAVAHKLERRWIGCEWSRTTVEEFTHPRLAAVVEGRDSGGVAAAVAEPRGFRVLDVAPSMFQVIDGRVVLADWATNGALAEAMAAQVGFEFVDEAPFSGKKGRQRLAVVDGLVNEDVVRLLLPWLDEDELLTVYGTAIDPDCKPVLSELRRGSVLRKMPESVLDDYRRGPRRAGGLDWPTVQDDRQTATRRA